MAGAVASALFFGKIFQVHIKSFGLVALALTVWIIYTVDHLRDARKIEHSASTRRHRFHQENFRILIIFLVIALAIDAIAIFFIRRQVFEWGLILTSMVSSYLIFHRSLQFLKELFASCLYTSGVILLSISVTDVQVETPHLLLIIQFALTAWINLVLFSWFDLEFDKRDDQNSFVTILGKKTTQKFLISLHVVSVLLTIVQIAVGAPLVPVGILFFMNATLAMIFFKRDVFEKHDRYRLIGDAVFIFPVLSLLM
jgi:4-hydroxybenzoate polyprenyltransferase